MLVWLLGKLWVNRMNIPLRRSAFEGGGWLRVGQTVSVIGQSAFADIGIHDAASQDHPL